MARTILAKDLDIAPRRAGEEEEHIRCRDALLAEEELPGGCPAGK